MIVFITGATGFIGQHLTIFLARHGHVVSALYRSFSKTKDLLHENIKWVKGDVTDPDSLNEAMQNCDTVIHLAAYAKSWSSDKLAYHKINYLGTKNVLEIAMKNEIKKVIIVSTAGVFGPSFNMRPINESTERATGFFSEYERTKDAADRLIMDYFSKKLNVCIVCPTRVYGPGELSESNSVTKIIKQYMDGRFRFLPGNGESIGNYVFIEDVVNGIIHALEKGRNGERYVLGGENLSFNQLFHHISAATGKNYKLFNLPTWFIIFLASILKLLADLFSGRPLITPGWARKYLHHWIVSSEKAKKELGYKPVSFEEGLKKTVEWINSVQRI